MRACTSPRGSWPSRSHPWNWGTQRLGHTDPTWARPSGPFHRRACSAKGQGHTVSELRVFAPPWQAASHRAPSWGLSYGPLASSQLRGAGKLLLWQPEQLLRAHCSVLTRACGGCLPKPSWSPQHLRLPFKAFQGRGPKTPRAVRRPAALTLLRQPTSMPLLRLVGLVPNLLPRSLAAWVLCLPQRHV